MAAWADIFTGAARFPGFRGGSVCGSFGKRSKYLVKADGLAHLQVFPSLLCNEIQKRKAGACNRPSVFWVLLNAKPVAFGNLLILPIVVKVSGTAGVLDTFFCGKTMTHLMQKRTARVFYGAAKCGAADVDFIPPLVTCLPNLTTSEKTTGKFQPATNVCSRIWIVWLHC